VKTKRFDSRKTAAAGAFGWADDPQPYFDAIVAAARPASIDDETLLHLARLYGSEYVELLDLVERDPRLGTRLSERDGRLDIAAQAVFAVTHEGARTLSDVIDRRLVLGTLGSVSRTEVETVATFVAGPLGWSVEATTAAVESELARRAAVAARWRRTVV